jgi:hypothetical protein
MNDHGRRKDGTLITDADVEAMADEAERGYDVDTLLCRRPAGRRWDRRQPVSNPCGWTRNSNEPC